MGTRIAVVRKGILQQEGSPQAVFNRPVNLFVASFIGSPAMNVFQARIDKHAGRLACFVGPADKLLPLPDDVIARHKSLGSYVGRAVAVGIRPDHLAHADVGNGLPTLEGRVAVAEMLGADQLVHLQIAAEAVLTDEILEVASDTDAAVLTAIQRDARDHRVLMTARVNADISFEVGSVTRIAIQTDRLHFFDLQTGASVR